MKIAFVAAALIAVTSTAALADPKPNPNSNQSPVAQATLAYKASGYPAGSTGQVISARNTDPANTYYQDNGYANRGDEVSTLAHQ